jgi:hypothetical protein
MTQCQATEETELCRRCQDPRAASPVSHAGRAVVSVCQTRSVSCSISLIHLMTQQFGRRCKADLQRLCATRPGLWWIPQSRDNVSERRMAHVRRRSRIERQIR